MKSKISLDFADLFGNGCQPYIKVDIERNSDDPRDKLLSLLFEGVGDTLSLHYSGTEGKRQICLWREDREPQHPFKRFETEPITNFRWAHLQMICGYKVKRSQSNYIYSLDQASNDIYRTLECTAERLEAIPAELMKAEDWEVVEE